MQKNYLDVQKGDDRTQLVKLTEFFCTLEDARVSQLLVSFLFW